MASYSNTWRKGDGEGRLSGDGVGRTHAPAALTLALLRAMCGVRTVGKVAYWDMNFVPCTRQQERNGMVTFFTVCL
jgi:hypothetical protein